jgi:hypothetical protein
MNESSHSDRGGKLAPKIVEIGQAPLMWRAFPDTTEFFCTWPEQRENPDSGFQVVSLSSLPRLMGRLQSPQTDLIVVHSSPFAPWHLRGISRSVFRRSALHGHVPFLRTLAPQLLRRKAVAPVAVVDLDDPPVIPRSELFLLDRATLYFKRELPPDHWRVFAGTVHWTVPTPRFRSIPRHQARLSKVRPISLGLSSAFLDWDRGHALPTAEKTVDVFFAGRVFGSSTLRRRGVEELRALQAEGYRIDLCDSRLPIDEYLLRCARAHIVWSPEGLGWQSFRAYEAALCGSVPMCNRPTIELYKPLVAGVHALYYEPEPGSLRRAIMLALAQPARLGQIAAAARDHVLAHHTPRAIAHHVLAQTLQAAGMSAYSDVTAAHP